ncbi:MAG: 2-phosphosulfolactate phosphatase [Dehalococcoidia bacterium]
MLKRIDVAVLPSEALAMTASAYVVVDALRATTTIATLFHRGLNDLVVLDDMAAARARAAEDRRLLFGEVGGIRPEGFDYGNSPTEAQSAEVEGRGAVLFTTNGTRALCALGEHGAVYAGAPANATALADALHRHEHAVLVCAGTDDARRFALEDFAAVGMMLHVIQRTADGVSLGDAAGLALRAAARPPGATRGRPLPSPGELLMVSSEHARKLKALGFERDVAFCAEVDTSKAVPMVVSCGPGWALLRDSR